MLIQPFVENAIEHAFKTIDYKGKLNIYLELNKQFILCKIDDNGIGIENSKKSADSASTKLIGQLLKNMTKQEVKTLHKSSPESGTIIVINIPYKEVFD
jgi:LytS/YehU family sensor histidine kinase